MIDNGLSNGLALYERVMEHRDELLREAEKERLVRLAMSGREPRKSVINLWMNFLGKKLAALGTLLENESGTGAEADILP